MKEIICDDARTRLKPDRKLLIKQTDHESKCDANLQGKYYEAAVQSIDTNKKTLVACFPDDVGLDSACFQLEYDILVLGEFSSSDPVTFADHTFI